MKLKTLVVLTLVLITTTAFISSQDQLISGVVTEKNDDLPLPGVNVQIKCSKVIVQSDFDGKFEIKAKEGDVLVFSYLKMETKEVKVGSKKSIKVILEPASNNSND